MPKKTSEKEKDTKQPDVDYLALTGLSTSKDLRFERADVVDAGQLTAGDVAAYLEMGAIKPLESIESLAALGKDKLIALAKSLGVEVTDDNNKAEIADKIRHAEIEKLLAENR